MSRKREELIRSLTYEVRNESALRLGVEWKTRVLRMGVDSVTMLCYYETMV